MDIILNNDYVQSCTANVYDEDTLTTKALDVTGFTIYFTVKEKSDVKDYGTDDSKAIFQVMMQPITNESLDTTNGEYEIPITHEQTLLLDISKKYVYDIFAIDVNHKQHTLQKINSISLIPSVTML